MKNPQILIAYFILIQIAFFPPKAVEAGKSQNAKKLEEICAVMESKYEVMRNHATFEILEIFIGKSDKSELDLSFKEVQKLLTKMIPVKNSEGKFSLTQILEKMFDLSELDKKVEKNSDIVLKMLFSMAARFAVVFELENKNGIIINLK